MANSPFSYGIPIISDILNYFSQVNANDTNLQIAREANQNSRQIAQEQNDWNYWMWQQQNAYNDPSAQVARLKAAGINPGLAYANGNMMNEAAPAAPAAGADVHMSRVQPYFVDPLTMAQIANINADTKQKEAQTDLFGSQVKVNESSIESDKVRLEMEGRHTDAEIGYLTKQTELIDHKLVEIDASVDQIRANIRWTDAQTAKQDLENLFNEKSMQDRLDQEHQKFLNMCKQYGLMDSELALNRQEFQQLAEMFVINKSQAEQTLAMLVNEREISDKTKLLDINNAIMENQANKVELAGQKFNLRVANEKYARHGGPKSVYRYVDDTLGMLGQVLSGAAMIAVPAMKGVKARPAGFRQAGAN